MAQVESMTPAADDRERRVHAERTAIALLAIAAVVMAIICGAIIVSGWFAGVMEDHAERWFWAGSILELLMVFVFAAAVFPGGGDDRRVIRRVTVLTRIGLVMFVAAPVMVLGSMVFDFYG
jgi:hypothetical protein